MKFLARATLGLEAGNAFVRDKEMSHKMEALLAEVRPESVYFGVEKGQRTIYCLVNVENGYEIPRIAEPFWLGLQATVEFIPVMAPDEFKKASSFIETASRKFSWY